MKKMYIILIAVSVFLSVPASASAAAAAWKPVTPDGYAPISWAKAPGIVTYFKAPGGNGSLDFLTRIYLPQNQIGFISSSSTVLDWGVADPDFMPDTSASGQISSDTDPANPLTLTTGTTTIVTIAATTTSDAAADTNIIHNFAFMRLVAETAKNAASTTKFIWNAPFFNITNSVTDLSMALKSTVGTSTLITSGSRPSFDMAESRRMLIINNKTGKAVIRDFDPVVFVSSSAGDQGLEGFAPTVAKIDSASGATGRLFLGVATSSKELIIYCSQQATIRDASDALLAAGVPLENQLEADGGGSAACGYNLPGQFFVEPTRILPLLMGATTILYRGTASTEGLNVRSGPSTKYAIVVKLKKNEPVRVYEEKNGWYRIGSGQWVLKTLIKKSA
jgi:hypothetical protein